MSEDAPRGAGGEDERARARTRRAARSAAGGEAAAGGEGAAAARRRAARARRGEARGGGRRGRGGGEAAAAELGEQRAALGPAGLRGCGRAAERRQADAVGGAARPGRAEGARRGRKRRRCAWVKRLPLLHQGRARDRRAARRRARRRRSSPAAPGRCPRSPGRRRRSPTRCPTTAARRCRSPRPSSACSSSCCGPRWASCDDARSMGAEQQRDYIAALKREQIALRSGLEARGVVFRDVVSYYRVWNGFAATVSTRDIPRLTYPGSQVRTVRRAYPGQRRAGAGPRQGADREGRPERHAAGRRARHRRRLKRPQRLRRPRLRRRRPRPRPQARHRPRPHGDERDRARGRDRRRRGARAADPDRLAAGPPAARSRPSRPPTS